MRTGSELERPDDLPLIMVIRGMVALSHGGIDGPIHQLADTAASVANSTITVLTVAVVVLVRLGRSVRRLSLQRYDA